MPQRIKWNKAVIYFPANDEHNAEEDETAMAKKKKKEINKYNCVWAFLFFLLYAAVVLVSCIALGRQRRPAVTTAGAAFLLKLHKKS